MYSQYGKNPEIEHYAHSPFERKDGAISFFRLLIGKARFDSYANGYVKCAQCGATLQIPNSFYGISTKILYFILSATITWTGFALLLNWHASHMSGKILMVFVSLTCILLGNNIVDRIIMACIFSFGKWKTVRIEPGNEVIHDSLECNKYHTNRRYINNVTTAGHVLSLLILLRVNQEYVLPIHLVPFILLVEQISALIEKKTKLVGIWSAAMVLTVIGILIVLAYPSDLAKTCSDVWSVTVILGVAFLGKRIKV